MGVKQDILIRPPRRVATSLDCQAIQEFLVQLQDGRKGLIDLFITKPGTRHRIACEAELQGRRIESDVRKSEAARATECWIIVPNNQVGRAAQKRVQRVATGPHTPAIYVVTVPQALAVISEYFTPRQ